MLGATWCKVAGAVALVLAGAAVMHCAPADKKKEKGKKADRKKAGKSATEKKDKETRNGTKKWEKEGKQRLSNKHGDQEEGRERGEEPERKPRRKVRAAPRGSSTPAGAAREEDESYRFSPIPAPPDSWARARTPPPRAGTHGPARPCGAVDAIDAARACILLARAA
eukprot:TRINITY_DN27786_c0_g1_i1.p3 TRINITY_DN27786_c0_g1~~TRINITY_DN27786_c0_g1_i1.p3  ORF type:complete len:167 (+),score=57.49 TRINITY_DN27786_c0_g1_i1:85-585(+)